MTTRRSALDDFLQSTYKVWNEEEQKIVHKRYFEAIQPTISVLKSTKKRAKLTRKMLKHQQDWLDWEAAERKQLQQYETQGMFSEPVMIPEGANSLPFMWTYV